MSAPTSMASASAAPVPPPTPVRRPRASLLILRIVVALTTLQTLAQPILAGAYLQGEFDALALHRTNALLIFPMLLLQIVAALIYWLPGRGRVIPFVASVFLFLALGLQLGMGYARLLAVHIPLGGFIVTLTVLLAIWVFSRRASVGRTPRSARTSPVVLAKTARTGAVEAGR